MKGRLRWFLVLAGGALLLTSLISLLNEVSPYDRAHVAMNGVKNLNRALMNRQETDPAFVPAEDFASMVQQLGGERLDRIADQLEYGSLFYRGGRLEAASKEVRFLYSSNYGSAIYFSDGSAMNFAPQAKVVFRESDRN